MHVLSCFAKNVHNMSGIGTRGRGRTSVAGRGRGRGSQASATADSSSSTSVLVALPAADAVPLQPVFSEHLGSAAGSSAPVTPVPEQLQLSHPMALTTSSLRPWYRGSYSSSSSRFFHLRELMQLEFSR